jgi:archaellum biogenesis protein FlaJ (TadC family)
VHNGPHVPRPFRHVIDWYAGLGLEISIALILFIAVATTVGGIAVVVRLPADHFVHRPDPASYTGWRRHRALRIAFMVSKNLLGLLILPLGIIMSLPLVPGPGLVFMLLGLSLLNFPGKRALERALIRRPTVMRILTRMRGRFGKPPFEVDAD